MVRGRRGPPCLRSRPMPGAPTPATVTTAPLARRRSGGLLLFASGSHEPLARRPTDIALAILTAFVIVLVGVLHSVASDVGAAAMALAASLPDFFEPLWSALVWTALGWALALVVVAAARHRMVLLASMAAGMALGGLAALGLHVLITGGSWGSAWRFMGLDGPPSFPPGAITIASRGDRRGVAVPHPPVPAPRPVAHRRRGRRLDAARRAGDRRGDRHGRGRPAGGGDRAPRRRVARWPPDELPHRTGTGRARRRRPRAPGGADAPLGRHVVHRHRRCRAAGGQGLRPRCLGCPAARHVVAAVVVPRRATDGAAEPTPARRARGVHHPVDRAGRGASAAARRRRERRQRRRPAGRAARRPAGRAGNDRPARRGRRGSLGGVAPARRRWHHPLRHRLRSHRAPTRRHGRLRRLRHGRGGRHRRRD